MYVDRTPLGDTKSLEQGDILSGLLRPMMVTEKSFARQQGPKLKWPAPAGDLSAPHSKDLRVVARLEVVDALVVSNACDNNGGRSPLLFAPIRPFRFPSNVVSDLDQWNVISAAATSTANPKLFYLPASQQHGMARAEAQLAMVFPLSHAYVVRCVAEAGTMRRCGITAEAQRHLQYAISLTFSRHPREDYDWPSVEDLELKRTWLQDKLSSGTPFKERYDRDLAEVESRLAVKQAAGSDVATHEYGGGTGDDFRKRPGKDGPTTDE